MRYRVYLIERMELQSTVVSLIYLTGIACYSIQCFPVGCILSDPAPALSYLTHQANIGEQKLKLYRIYSGRCHYYQMEIILSMNRLN